MNATCCCYQLVKLKKVRSKSKHLCSQSQKPACSHGKHQQISPKRYRGDSYSTEPFTLRYVAPEKMLDELHLTLCSTTLNSEQSDPNSTNFVLRRRELLQRSCDLKLPSRACSPVTIQLITYTRTKGATRRKKLAHAPVRDWDATSFHRSRWNLFHGTFCPEIFGTWDAV